MKGVRLINAIQKFPFGVRDQKGRMEGLCRQSDRSEGAICGIESKHVNAVAAIAGIGSYIDQVIMIMRSATTEKRRKERYEQELQEMIVY
jgi:hypothetical protein